MGGSEGIGWIFGEVTPPLRVELTGLGEGYNVQISGEQSDLSGGYEAEGFLAAGKKISVTVETDTQAPSALFLPLIAHNNRAHIAPTGSLLNNGDFEQGPSHWDEVANFDLIVDRSSLPVPPHGGDWAAWLGGVLNDESRIEQSVTVAVWTLTSNLLDLDRF